MSSLDAVPRRAERVASRVVDGTALVVVIDDQELHRLNEVGTRVWELCDGRPLAAIVDAIVEEFAVERETAVADVQRFVEELGSKGALQWGDP